METEYANTIKVPKEFFIKERDQSYSNWREAFFRELFTNSIDAEATEIVVTIKRVTIDKEYQLISFRDNGHGMDLVTLENVYFQLGKSTRDSSSVGGFGRARILTNFAASSYEIITQDWLVKGSGAQYTVSKSSEFYQGCHQAIYMDASELVPGELQFLEYLKTVTTDVKIYLNGDFITANFDKGKFSRDFMVGETLAGKIYYNENLSSMKGDIFIRVNGITMFSHWVNVPYTVTLELLPELSRTLLVSNRDDFKDNAKVSFFQFVHEIQGNKASIRNTVKRIRKTYKGFGVMVAKKGRIPLSDNPAFTQLPAFSERLINRGIRIEHANNELEKYAVNIKTDTTPLNLLGDNSAVSDSKFEYQKGYVIPISSLLPDMVFYVDTDNISLIREAESYNPEHWKIRLVGNKTEWGVWRKYFNLLMTWRVVCEIVVDIAIKNNVIGTEFRWSVGWVFRDDIEAQHDVSGGVHFYTLRPITDDGKSIFDVHKTSSIRHLIALARHEVCHTFHNHHDERFANLLTDMDSYGGERRIYKAVKDLLSCK